MDKYIIRYVNYDDYLTDKNNISKNSIVYIEDKRIIIIKQKEYQCVKTIDFNDLDTLKDDDPANAYKYTGLYFVTGNFVDLYNISYGLLISYTDSMCHGCHQILIGNNTTDDGAITGHSDKNVTILFRAYSYTNSVGTIGQWTKWTEINFNNIISSINSISDIRTNLNTLETSITNLTNDVSDLKDTKYPIIRTTNILYEDGNLYLTFGNSDIKNADILLARRDNVLTPINDGFDIYISSNFTKFMIDYLYDNNIAFKTIKFRIFTGSSKVLNAGFYAQNATSLLSFSKQNNEGYIATDSTNKIYYRTLNPASANKKAINGMFINGELNVYVKTTSTGYSTIELKLD